jgi:anti-sigma factor RsiW
MSTTAHPIAPEEIMAFLDGQLSAEQAQSVSAHIATCTECRQVADAIRSSSNALSDWSVPASPVNVQYEIRLSEAARKVLSKPRPLAASRLRVFLRQHWLLTAASSAVLAGIVVTTSTTFRKPSTMERWADSSLYVPPPPAGPQAAGSRGSLGKLQSVDNAGMDKLVAGAKLGGAVAGSIGDHAQNLFSNDIADQQSQTFAGPMIARTVSLAIIVKNFDAARASLDSVLARHNGYAAGLNVNTPQGAARSLQAALRIPAPQLTAALAELRTLGHVENEAQSGEEVTQQHADLVARLKNSRETEQRLQAILVQRTGKISDVLSVEQEIARVRGEVEQMEAEQKNLEHRVDFATIDLKLAEEYKAQLGSSATSVSTQLHNALVTGYKSAAESLLGLVLFFVEYGQVLVLWFAILAMPAWLVWCRWQRAAASI